MLARPTLRPAFRAAAQLFALAAALGGLAALTPASWRPSRAAPPATATFGITLDTLRADPGFNAILWLDVRRAADFAAGHIPGALLFDEAAWDAQLPALLDRWTPETPVVVYCDSPACGTSERVATRLRQELGVDNIHSLVGGWAAWSTTPSP